MCYIKIIVSNKTICASKLLRPELVSPLAIAEGIIAKPQVSQQKVANSFFRCRQCTPATTYLYCSISKIKSAKDFKVLGYRIYNLNLCAPGSKLA